MIRTTTINFNVSYTAVAESLEPLSAMIETIQGDTSEKTSAALVAELSRLPASVAEARLRALDVVSDPVVRAWAAWAAPRALPPEAATRILKEFARDRDPDVRDTALEEWLDLGVGPDDAAALRKRLIGQLRSGGPGENFALWALARLRDRDALPAIREFGIDADEPWKALAADVASLVILGQRSQILRRIREHDHDSMLWLAAAARVMPDPELLQALQAGAQELPDIDCRAICSAAVVDLKAEMRRSSEM
jgi:hypothetical protein